MHNYLQVTLNQTLILTLTIPVTTCDILLHILYFFIFTYYKFL